MCCTQNQGVTDVKALLPTLQAMAVCGLLLLVHGEVTDPSVDIFDRERRFLPTVEWILSSVPALRVVLEHATTADAVELLRRHADSGRLAATFTPQHLLHSRNALFEGGLNPHLYCLPILKTESDRQALLGALFDPHLSRLVFAGTDSAPHPRANKQRSECCAAGCFSAYGTVELYAQAILPECIARGLSAAEAEKLLEGFFTSNAARFYGLDLNPPRPVRIRRKQWSVPHTMVRGGKQTHAIKEMHEPRLDPSASDSFSPDFFLPNYCLRSQPFGDDVVVPLGAGKTLDWTVEVESAAASQK